MFESYKRYKEKKRKEKETKQQIEEFASIVFKNKRTSYGFAELYLKYIGKSYSKINYVYRICNEMILGYDKPGERAGEFHSKCVDLLYLKEIYESNPDALVIPKFV